MKFKSTKSGKNRWSVYLEAFLTIVIICIDHDERSVNHVLCCKHSLASSPRLCPIFRKSSRDIVDILKSVINGHIMLFTGLSDTVTNDFFEFLFDIFPDNKYNMSEACLDCIMDQGVHDDMIRCIYWLQLFDSYSKSATDSSHHNK